MKKILIFLASIFVSIGVDAQEQHWLDPSVVSIGKELPRGNVVSFGTRSDALRENYHASPYLQPLSQWSRSETADAVVYKTSYKFPFAWIDRQLFLYVGKVSASFDVVINGEPVGYSQTGSTPSEFDVTMVSREGNNSLEIAIYKKSVAQTLENSRPAADPQIQGEVYILSQPRMRVRDIYADTRMEGTRGLLQMGVILKNHQLNAKEYRVQYELISPKGEIVSEGYNDAVLDMRREDTVHFFANITDIIPWSHEQPSLYTLLVRTRHEGRYMEYLSFRVGFRSLELKEGQIYLNDVPLRMTMREFTPSSDMDAMRSRIGQLRSEGVGVLKLQGAPPSHRFYELCDEMGVYLCNQADIDTRLSGTSRKVGGNPSNDPVWEGAYLDRVMNMYHTSKNSPSMIMFSLAGESANGYNLYESYLALKAAEKHRPVIYTDGGEWNSDRVNFNGSDGVPYNYGDSWATVTALNNGSFRIHNSRYITPIIGEAAYRISVGKKTVSQGAIPLRVLPQDNTDIAVPVTGVKAGKDYTIHIDIMTDRPVNKYAPTEEEGSKRVLRFTGTGGDTDKVTIGQGSFPSRP